MGIFINFCAGANEDVLAAAQVDALLVNVPQNLINEAALVKTKHLIATAGAVYVMQDSGGYQFYSMEQAGGKIGFDPYKPAICRQPIEINLGPPHIIDAAVKLRPSVMTGLDWPINKITNKFDRDVEFMKKFGFNIKWIQDMVDLKARRCPDIPLFLPIQCYDLNQLKFYEIYLRDLPYDGLSLPTRNLDSVAIILLLMKFHLMGVRRVHLLSVSNLTGIAIACYFARNIFDWCSVDATTWRMSADYGIYLDPYSLKKKSFDPTRNFNFSSICDCPWCSYRTYFQFLDTPQTDQTSFLRCHNYYAIKKAGEDCWENSYSARDLGRCLMARAGAKNKNINRLIQALTIVETSGNININFLKDLLKVEF
jgi:queuine/archaeosine tRNA-ribosyltransferase